MPRTLLNLILPGTAGGGLVAGIFYLQTGALLQSLILFGAGMLVTIRLIALALHIPQGVPRSIQLAVSILLVMGAGHLFQRSSGLSAAMLMVYYVVSALFFASWSDGNRR